MVIYVLQKSPPRGDSLNKIRYKHTYYMPASIILVIQNHILNTVYERG
jgi:hypothetical protein